MAQLTPQNIVETGLAATYASADANGDTVKNPSDGRLFLHFKNTNGSTRTITVTAKATQVPTKGYGTLTRGNISVTLTATTGEHFVGPFEQAFNNTSGNIEITYSATSGVTVAALRLPNLSGR